MCMIFLLGTDSSIQTERNTVICTKSGQALFFLLRSEVPLGRDNAATAVSLHVATFFFSTSLTASLVYKEFLFASSISQVVCFFARSEGAALCPLDIATCATGTRGVLLTSQ